jgi:hypothetical protein
MWTNRSRTLFSVLILSITIFAVQTTSLAQTSVKVEPPFPSRMMKDDEITVKVKIDPVPDRSRSKISPGPASKAAWK